MSFYDFSLIFTAKVFIKCGAGESGGGGGKGCGAGGAGDGSGDACGVGWWCA